MQPTPIQSVSRRERLERLERWAELLERDPDHLVSSLEEIKWKPKCEWARLRADNSALTVAFAIRSCARKDSRATGSAAR